MSNKSPPIFSEIFHQYDICNNSKSNSEFPVPGVNSVFDGSKSIIYLGLTICDICTLEIKECRKCWCLQEMHWRAGAIKLYF